jgi:signal transduction histidine kinase
VASLLLLAWSIHWLRVRRVVARFQLIAAERTRFTRELHDSLLQGFSGVVFQLEAAARQFDAAPVISKQRLTRALDQADESLREARQMILSMRIPALENSTLPEALSATTAQIVEGMPVHFDFRVTGRVRQGHYDLEANIFLIVREAVTNAITHASAPHIWVELNYSGKSLRLTVRDDGAGMDPEAALAKTGHWGLRGMKERVKQLGGDFTLESAPGQGTRLEVSVPWKS